MKKSTRSTGCSATSGWTSRWRRSRRSPWNTDRGHTGQEAERLFGQEEAPNEDQTFDLLAKETPDMALLDLVLGASEVGQQTVPALDQPPPVARAALELVRTQVEGGLTVKDPSGAGRSQRFDPPN